MIMTIVTSNGRVAAAAHGDLRRPDTRKPTGDGAFTAGLLAGPGQEIRVVDVADSIAQVDHDDPDEFGRRLTAYLTERGLL